MPFLGAGRDEAIDLRRRRGNHEPRVVEIVRVEGAKTKDHVRVGPREANRWSDDGDPGPRLQKAFRFGLRHRAAANDEEGFEGSGADWLERYKPYIEDGKTVVASPHKVYGPETNDLVLQLRKRGIDKIILAGMSANLCTESHMRELLEQGFEVAVIKDATAAGQVAEGDGYESAVVNFRFIANTVWTTAELVERLATTDATQ